MEEFNLEPHDFKFRNSVVKNHLKINKFEANIFLAVQEQKYCQNVISTYQKQDMASIHKFHIDMYLRDLKLQKA